VSTRQGFRRDCADQFPEEDTVPIDSRIPSRLAALGAAALFATAALPGMAAARSVVPGHLQDASASPAAPDLTPAPADLTALIAAAQAEGGLNVIALPRDWCNYGALLDGFTAKYGIPINSINPGGGSGDELQAIQANEQNGGPQAPDVVDVGITFGPEAVSEGLLAPYKVSTWDTIDEASKDPNGYWYGDYYGVLSFAVNTDVAASEPKDWSDLLGADFKDSVALAGDPTASNQAIQSVYAAALANGGSLDNAQPGLDFFKQLNDAGNFVPTIAGEGTLASGETPVIVTWNYLAQADKDSLAGNPNIDVVIPASGLFGGKYAQAISAYAPHPNAAKLWEEYLYSDEGQLGWLDGYCYTTRLADLQARNVIPADLAAKLPDVSGAVFPSAAQLDAAKTLITSGWKSEIGVTVAAPPTPVPSGSTAP
jgi:putative spermidine/putrescine transport system substrate-binding protein